jgi:hypothetical protein
MDVLGANRFRRVVCSKRYCGFSTQARNGTELQNCASAFSELVSR